MPIFILYAAGVAAIGGGLQLISEANRRRAEDAMRQRQDLEAMLLRGEIELEDLRRQARDAGLDPQTVVNGYLAMNAGQLTVDDVQRLLSMV